MPSPSRFPPENNRRGACAVVEHWIAPGSFLSLQARLASRAADGSS